MITITTQAFMAALHAVVASDPDRVYADPNSESTACYYTMAVGGTEGRGCLLGETLLSLGIDRDWLRAVDTQESGADNIEGVIDKLRNEGMINLSEGGAGVIVPIALCAQRDQDNGGTWRGAWEAATDRPFDPDRLPDAYDV